MLSQLCTPYESEYHLIPQCYSINGSAGPARTRSAGQQSRCQPRRAAENKASGLCKTLASKTKRVTQPFEYRSVRYWSKEINGTLPGGRKNKFFNSRSGRGRGHRAAAPVESCQSLPEMSPWGRLGSVLYTCKRLHRVRRRFQHFFSISLDKSAHWTRNSLAMASRALREH